MYVTNASICGYYYTTIITTNNKTSSSTVTIRVYSSPVRLYNELGFLGLLFIYFLKNKRTPFLKSLKQTILPLYLLLSVQNQKPLFYLSTILNPFLISSFVPNL